MSGIIIYNSAENNIELQVSFDNETVWLNRVMQALNAHKPFQALDGTETSNHCLGTCAPHQACRVRAKF